MKGFDIFRKIRDDVETSTWVGGIYSILAFLAGMLLIFIEIHSYSQTTWVKEFRVESDDVHSKMDLFIDITMKRAPCYLLSVHIEDDLEHRMKPETVNYTRIDMNGAVKPEQKYKEEGNGSYKGSETEKNDIWASVDQKEGCRLSIYSIVDKVPGKVLVGFSDMRDRFVDVASHKPHENINLDYKLNRVDFGEDHPTFKSFKQFNGEPLNYQPYLGLEPGDGKTMKSYTSFFKVVPTRFITNKNDKLIETMQYSQSFRDINVSPTSNPLVTFKYEVSPIIMIFRVEDTDFYYLVVQLCAVVGGIFALMGILNSLTWESISFLKKME